MSEQRSKSLVAGCAFAASVLLLTDARQSAGQQFRPYDRYRLPALVSVELTDEAVVDQIKKRLSQDPLVSSDLVNVENNGGAVTLRGTVRSWGARGRATLVAQDTPGVLSVLNDLQVAPSQVPFDYDIRQSVESAMRGAGTFEFAYVQVRVENGVVYLSGPVRTQQVKDWASEIVRNLPYVAAVRNNLRIQDRTPPSDEALESAIRRAMVRQAFSNPEAVRIDVHNGGRVVLSGLVDGVDERARAIRIAWTAGATSVDASRLEPIPQGQPDRIPDAKYVLPTDTTIRLLVESALLEDRRVSTLPVRVDVIGRIATLRGDVNSLADRRLAGDIASRVIGVRQVINELRVRPQEIANDQAIFQQILGELRRDPNLAEQDVSVTVLNGVVTILGTVGSEAMRRSVENLIGGIPGVARVDSKVEVDPEAVASRPTLPVR